MNTDRTQHDVVSPKEAQLKEVIGRYDSMAIAYSGGVDSTYLAAVAYEVLGRNAHVVIADSPSLPRAELREAVALAEERGWNLVVLRTEEFSREEFLSNDGRRCYFCKGELFQKMRQYALDHHIAALAYGEIADDSQDPTRLGAIAAREHDILAPLQMAGLFKLDIRRLSAQRGLPTWDKASFACLSSRFPKGTPITPETLQQVEQAEEVLRTLGFHQYRARHHGDICRVEIDPEDFNRLLDPETRRKVVEGITAAGYRFVALDLAGYRMGSIAES
jgi:uncharacterized protein